MHIKVLIKIYTTCQISHISISDSKVIYNESLLITCYICYREIKVKDTCEICIPCDVLAMFLAITKIYYIIGHESSSGQVYNCFNYKKFSQNI